MTGIGPGSGEQDIRKDLYVDIIVLVGRMYIRCDRGF